MRLTFFALVTGIVAGWAGGGRVGGLGRVPLRWWLLPAAAIPLYIVTGRRSDISYAYILFVASLVGVVLFVLRNLRVLPALVFVGVGIALNLTTILVNHGMPYSIDALHHSGVAERTPDRLFRSTVQSHPQRANDRLLLFTDRISLEPLRELLSIGDIVMAFGLGLTAYSAMLRYNDGPRGAHARRPTSPRAGSRHLTPGGATASAPATTVPIAATPAVLDLTLHDDRVLAMDPPIADPTVRAEADEGLTLIRLLARSPELAITDDLFRTRERVRILGAERIDTPELDDLARELAATRRRVRPTAGTVPTGAARVFARQDDRIDPHIGDLAHDLFADPVPDSRPDASH